MCPLMEPLKSSKNFCRKITAGKVGPISDYYPPWISFDHYLFHLTTSASHPPRVWMRYADYTSAAFENDRAQKFTDHNNYYSLDTYINFTNDPEKEGSMPYLDTFAKRSSADPSETVFQWEMNCATWARLRGDCALFRIKKRALRPFRRICTRPASS